MAMRKPFLGSTDAEACCTGDVVTNSTDRYLIGFGKQKLILIQTECTQCPGDAPGVGLATGLAIRVELVASHIKIRFRNFFRRGSETSKWCPGLSEPWPASDHLLYIAAFCPKPVTWSLPSPKGSEEYTC